MPGAHLFAGRCSIETRASQPASRLAGRERASERARERTPTLLNNNRHWPSAPGSAPKAWPARDQALGLAGGRALRCGGRLATAQFKWRPLRGALSRRPQLSSETIKQTGSSAERALSERRDLVWRRSLFARRLAMDGLCASWAAWSQAGAALLLAACG